MEHDPHPRNKSRETLVTLVFVVIGGGALVFFLNFVTFGVFFYVMAAVFGLVIVGYLHYVLWGHALSQEVAGEREEQQIKEQMESDREGPI